MAFNQIVWLVTSNDGAVYALYNKEVSANLHREFLVEGGVKAFVEFREVQPFVNSSIDKWAREYGKVRNGE